MLKELFSIFGVVKINNDNANKALDETTNKGKETARALSQHFETAGKIFQPLRWKDKRVTSRKTKSPVEHCKAKHIALMAPRVNRR